MAITMSGTVIRSTGSWSSVRLPDHTVIECKLPGRFRTKGLRTTSPVAVGDHVQLTIEPDTPNIGVISHIEPRKNYVIRKSVNLSKEAHIIAANLDQAMLMATIAEPRTSLGFIDRFLATAEAYGIRAVIVFNKSDLNTSVNDDGLLKEYRSIYQHIGYRTFHISALTHAGIDKLRDWLQGKVTLLSGHSGVGKSTLINALIPNADLRTGDISQAHRKGKHVTSSAEMHPLDSTSDIIDTPGIKEFGMIDMRPEEISHYFPEIFRTSHKCRYYNCTHVNEPGCAVKRAVEQSLIAETRYSSYISIIESI